MKLVVAPAALAEFERTANFVLPIHCSVLYFVALVGDIAFAGSHTASSIKSPQRNFAFSPSHITGGVLAIGHIEGVSRQTTGG